jgi:hypothetical protein
MNRVRGAAELVALLVVAVALCSLVGHLNPLPRTLVGTDRLGPDNGEAIAEYIDRAAASVTEARADFDPHWALVSFDSVIAPTDAFDLARGVRIAEVLLRVPMERVQTQVIAIGVPGTEASVIESEDRAAAGLQSSTGQWDRQSQIDAASAVRLSRGCDCVVGLVVRATGTELASVSTAVGVRSVESRPADATAGRFAVRALLPDYVDVAGPLPDDGPIPPP